MSLLAREYVAAFPVIDDTLPLSALITEAEDALTGLLEADNLVQVGRYRWDLWEGPEGLSFVVIAPVVELEGSDAA